VNKVKIQYLGTGAAERVPAIFCDCRVCKQARKNKGKDVRTQSQTLIDDGDLMIDFPGDSYLHLLRDDLNFNGIEQLLITHWHSDHFYAEDLALRMQGYGQHLPKKLNVYGSGVVKEFYDRAFELEGRYDEARIEFHVIEPYQEYEVGHYSVFPIPAQHGLFKADSLVYAIHDQVSGKSILYLHDTGMPLATDLEALKNCGMIFDFVSMDCTGQGLKRNLGTSHMAFGDNLELIKQLRIRDLVHEDTIYVANHFSHNGGLTYAEMSAQSENYGVSTAYDGLTVEV
jgi:phosphoribosyl 1,2-cyclic phosphate phosphodiesterase